MNEIDKLSNSDEILGKISSTDKEKIKYEIFNDLQDVKDFSKMKSQILEEIKMLNLIYNKLT